METKKHLTELHKEHGLWSKELEFARDEIKSFNNRLSDVVTANTQTDILANVEHFQNQFIRHNEVIDELLHDVHSEEHKIVEQAKANNVATDHKRAEENLELVDRMQSFTKLFGELKDEFHGFLSQVL